MKISEQASEHEGWTCKWTS